MASNIQNRCRSYLEPLEPLYYAAWALFIILADTIRNRGYHSMISSGINSNHQIRDLAFAHWYRTLNDHFFRFEGKTAIPKLVSSARGVVLELGPGTGNQILRFDKSKIDHIYGIEHNTSFASDIRAQIAESGLAEKYTLITCDVEDSDILEQHGIAAGSVDTVVSIQILCSVAKPEKVAREIYRLLKPGGKLIFWEHHHSHDMVTRTVQNIWNIIWPYAIGGCNMNRDIEKILRGAGDWVNFDTIESDEKPWSMLPRIWGDYLNLAQMNSRPISKGSYLDMAMILNSELANT